MRATQATFKLGILFDDCKDIGTRYFHSFGLTGKDHWSAGFQHFWLHGRAKGHDAPYEDYCLELVAALAGKFAHLPDDRLNYSYQLDSGLYSDRNSVVKGKNLSVRVDPGCSRIIKKTK